jgi:mono/diheme cytochrome c family protein
MSTRRNLRFRSASWLTIVAAVLMHCGAVQARDLAFCIDKASPAAAIDTRLGQAIGKSRGLPVRFFYYEGLPKGDDDDFDLHEYKDMFAEKCDLVLAFPHDGQGGLPPFLHTTKPYASTGFTLVTPRRGGYATLASMPQGTHVAVVYNTYANYYFRHHHNLVADIVADDADALRSIARKEVAGALLWRPAAVQQIEQRHLGSTVGLHEIDEPASRWNLVALYGATGEAAAHDFDAAIQTLRTNGKLARILGLYADTATLDQPAHGVAQANAAPGQTPSPHVRTTRQTTCGNAKPAKPLPALFTEAQANTGKQLFSDKCALCHGANLEGRVGPSLKGKMFLSVQAAHTVADIFRFLSQNMPATLPGSLSHDDYVNLMAFLMQQNGYPQGNAELTFDRAWNSKTLMIYHGE